MKTFLCVISGTTALLQHRFGENEEIQASTRAVHIKDEDPRDAAERVAYRNKDGYLYVPGPAVSRLMREAGSAHKQRGSRKSVKFVVPSATLVIEDQIILRDAQGAPLIDFEVDSRAVVIPATKGRIMRHRPRLNSWGCEFSVEIDADQIDTNLVLQLITEGGTKLGLGDYRPEKGGPFGRFQVVSWGELAQRVPLAEAAD
jgi:hypothetical protein